MTLFTRSCHGPNERVTLSCAGSVFGTQLMPYFVNSTSLVSRSVIRRYNRVNFRAKVNLGESSCYFDLRSNFQLDLPRSKYMCRCVLEERKTMVLELFRYLSLFEIYLRKTVNPQMAIFFSLPNHGARYDLKRSTRVPLDSEHTKNSFVLMSIRGEMVWGLHNAPPPSHARSKMGK